MRIANRTVFSSGTRRRAIGVVAGLILALSRLAADAVDYPLWVYAEPTMAANFAASTPWNYGSNSVPEGEVTNYLGGIVYDTNSVRYTYMGWRFTNNAGTNVTGVTTQAVFTITTNSQMTWRWTNTHYYLSVTAVAGGSVENTSGWYTNNAVVTNLATPDGGYYFLQWSGGTAVPEGSHTNNPLIVTMDRALALQANFASEAAVTRRWSGTGNWFTVTNWTPNGIPGTGDVVIIGSGNSTFGSGPTGGADGE